MLVTSVGGRQEALRDGVVPRRFLGNPAIDPRRRPQNRLAGLETLEKAGKILPLTFPPPEFMTD